ncbi:MAG: hypothetical protein HIU82_12975 [Proteobacteria bacterium]|nr:hypothetical protein [Pseudomonadota bacterium]
MTDTTERTAAPAEWLEALARSEADLAAGRIVSGEAVHRELQDSIARLEANAATRQREATARR